MRVRLSVEIFPNVFKPEGMENIEREMIIAKNDKHTGNNIIHL